MDYESLMSMYQIDNILFLLTFTRKLLFLAKSVMADDNRTVPLVTAELSCEDMGTFFIYVNKDSVCVSLITNLLWK